MIATKDFHAFSVILLLSIAGCDSLTRLKGTGILSLKNSASPFLPKNPSEPASENARPSIGASIGIKASSSADKEKIFNPNRQGKYYGNIVKGLTSLSYESKKTECNADGLKGNCLYIWECSDKKGLPKFSKDCANHFLHQCCITSPPDAATIEVPESPSTTFLPETTNSQLPIVELVVNETVSIAKQNRSTGDDVSLVKPPPLFGFTRQPESKNSSSTIEHNVFFDKSQLNPSVYDCGFRPLAHESRILGGRRAGFGNWPWAVSVRKIGGKDKDGSRHKSGGALISDQWVLTAAHTVARTSRLIVRGKRLVVRIGDYDFTDVEVEGREHINRRVSKVIVHPDFNGITFENDIALLKLDSKVEFEEHIQPVCLPHPEIGNINHRKGRHEIVDKNTGTVVGWGRVAQGGELSNVLLNVELPLVSNRECEKMFMRQNYTESIPDIFICAGGEGRGGRDSCQGDSGGPMMKRIDGGERWEVIGIVSWGIGCGVAGLPGVLTSVPHYTDWILSNINRYS